jgi:NADH-quinone oxidoreductase subunit N
LAVQVTGDHAAMEAAMAGWLAGIVPELVLAGAVTLLLPLGSFLPPRYRGASTWLALFALLAAAVASVPLLRGTPHAVFDGTYAVDPFAVFFKFMAIAATGLVILVTHGHFRGRPHEAHVPTLLLLTCLGLVALAASQDLVLIALFLTLVTVGSYTLVGIAKEDARAAEGALKLFLFGSAAAAVMFYGMTLLYGLTGSLNLIEIAGLLPQASRVTAGVSLAFVLVGYGFKVTLAPFHLWAPDTYQGAPTPIAAFLSVGPKAAGLAVLLRTLAVAVPGGVVEWSGWIAGLAALTMSLGNLVALRQTDMKRLLAYSSIAQAGYLLMGVAAYGRDPLAVPGMLAYLAVYVVMNLGAFLIVAAVGRTTGSDEIRSYAGLARRMPFAALVLAVTLLALAGIPPMGSYVGKAMLFAAAIGAGYAWLAVVAAVNTAISIVYYLWVLEAAYLKPTGVAIPTDEHPIVPPATQIAIALAGAATLLLGILPQPLLTLAERASSMLGP